LDILLTFDVEVWCGGWQRLDERFPTAFRRYVFGSSAKGNFGLPHILETLNRYGLKGVFFVEPMFAGRFGLEHLATIVRMLNEAEQEVQLHLHPEWTDEITPCPIPDHHSKRQHLHFYSLTEQRRLIQYGLKLLRTVHSGRVSAFRAGSFAANQDTLRAVKANGLLQDSSVNATMPNSVSDLRAAMHMYLPSTVDGISEYPLSVFIDGLRRQRHAQMGACSLSELLAAMRAAKRLGWPQFTILGHNFELLKAGSAEPDPIVVARFQGLCRYLSEHAKDFPTTGFLQLAVETTLTPAANVSLPRVPLSSTLQRYSEQLVRRFH
jgi:hypothetical protein